MNHLEATIADVANHDEDFKSLIDELCDGVNWDFGDFSGQSLATLLVSIVQEEKAITLQHVAVPRILCMRVSKLKYGSVIHSVCRDLLMPTNKPIEAFDTKNVLAVINERCRFIRSKLPKPKKPTKAQLKRYRATDLIKRARETRGLWG